MTPVHWVNPILVWQLFYDTLVYVVKRNCGHHGTWGRSDTPRRDSVLRFVSIIFHWLSCVAVAFTR